MSRLIDADDLLTAFPIDDEPMLTTSCVRMTIRHMPTIEPQRWIPVSERLPEENQICIVTDETMRNTYEYRFCKETYDENQGWTYLKHRIIAWMPLPEPYRSEA